MDIHNTSSFSPQQLCEVHWAEFRGSWFLGQHLNYNTKLALSDYLSQKYQEQKKQWSRKVHLIW